MNSLRDLPSVDAILQSPAAQIWLELYGRPMTLEAVRETLDQVRHQFSEDKHIPETLELDSMIQQLLQSWTAPTLEPVINATGVILHTNLGRAPLSNAALNAIHAVSMGYSNLEYDLEKGKRGSRLVHAESLLQHITGAKAALVVNNNASAVLLILTAMARRRAVVIARSQLVEIGGGFRIPEVMKQSGARLLEIGTTNRVHLSDYQDALEQNPALVLRAHRSNFRIVGFTSEPELNQIAAAAHASEVPVVDDLGSGSLLDTTRFGLGHEPTIQDSLAAGADLICFSGDKLLGGPQAGIVIGRADLLAKLKKHPMARALRADKLCLAALSATLLHYLKDEAEQEIPIWRMIAQAQDLLHQRVSNWADQLGVGQVISGQSTVGGGSLPGETLPTWLLAISSSSPKLLFDQLRRSNPPIIARLENDLVLLDARTVLADQEQALLSSLRELVG